MDSTDTAELAAILLSAPGWARHCLGVENPELREQAAREIAAFIVAHLRNSLPAQNRMIKSRLELDAAIASDRRI
jgi:hypothetical protein